MNVPARAQTAKNRITVNKARRARELIGENNLRRATDPGAQLRFSN
jgi:hypothetical protein